MKSFTLFICLIGLLVCTIGYGQQRTVAGTVRDAENAEPLPAATIYVQELNVGTTANAMGIFQFKNLPNGEYTLEISFVGFAKKIIPFTVASDSPQSIEVTMQPEVVRMEDVEVSQNLQYNATSFSAMDLRLRPIQTSQDVLKIVPGLFIAQHAGGGKAEQIFLRGFDIDHGTDISLEVDGMPVNMVSHAHGQGYADLHFVIPETIDRVAFDKGPYYSSIGNFNTAGYAHFYTKKRLSESSVKLEGGQFGTFRTVGLLNLISPQTTYAPSLYLATEFFRSDGYFESPQFFNRLNALLKYHQRLDSKRTLDISLSAFNSSWDASGQIPERAVENGTISRFGAIDDTEGGMTSRMNVNARLARELRNGAWTESQFYFTQYDFELVSNFTFFLNDPENGDQITQSEQRQIFGTRHNYWTEHQLLGISAQTELGVGFRHDINENVRLSRTLQRQTVLEDLAYGDVQETNIFAFAEEIFTLSPRFTMTTGLRFDHFTFDYRNKLSSTYERSAINKSVLSPKLQLSYQASERLNLYLKSGLGFHSNDSRVVVQQTGREILPKAYGVDVGIHWKPVDRLLINAALWRLDLDQEFVYVGDAGIVEPSGKTRREGIDLSIRYQANAWLYFTSDVNYTIPRAVGTAEGEHFIPLAPTFTSIGGLTAELTNALSGSLRYRFMDNRPANEDNSLHAEGYFLMDAVLNYTLGTFELGLSIENLTNAAWKEAQFETESQLRNESKPISEIHFTPGTPFQARLSATVRF
ncbi:TonB-dependent receptor [Roseivirga thermotolerans]|uniref:TonB-dependent receptor n=1 Tax=Roseivirga thermotolerans TaxID=1758176 RepID=UPI00273D182D|nr:TonB-dependent receptor [Roseivirga thermotolerans]